VSRTADRAAEAFRAWHGAEPEGVWHAPGRANLIGEHTDYNSGWVLPFALDRGVVVAATRRGDGVLDIRSLQSEGQAVVPLPGLGPGDVTGWAAYPAGVAWAMREAGLPVGGADLVIDSDLPQGAGLSSSAAIECAVAIALADLYRVDVPRTELARLARRAENEMVGVPSGIMDQSASLLCQAGHALLLDCRSGQTTPVPFDPAAAGLALLVVDTGVRHALTDGRYAERRAECERAARALGVPSLRDVADPARTAAIADPVLARRARHVISDNCRVLSAVDLLGAVQGDGDNGMRAGGGMAGLGQLLHDSHASLRDDFEISWPQADVAAEAAERAGALGARMVGGGFGGSVIALVPADATAVRAAVRAAYAGQDWSPPTFLDAPPSAGARRVLLALTPPPHPRHPGPADGPRGRPGHERGAGHGSHRGSDGDRGRTHPSAARHPRRARDRAGSSADPAEDRRRAGRAAARGHPRLGGDFGHRGAARGRRERACRAAAGRHGRAAGRRADRARLRVAHRRHDARLWA
jgi:galactokinase